MQRFFRTFRALSLFTLTLAAAGCGSEAAPAESPAGAIQAADGDPLAAIPPEEIYGASPVDNLWSPRYELEVVGLPAGWNGARVAVLSDFQLGMWKENEAVATAAVQRAIEAEPNLIVLLGGFIARGDDLAALQRVLAPLRGRNALAVLGGRDVRTDSLEAQITSALQGAGVRVLINNSVPVVVGGDTAWVAGVDPELGGEPAADQEWILLNAAPAGRAALLLTHSAGIALRAPEGRFPVILAGNTFCGDVEVPGSSRLTTLRDQVLAGATVEGIDNLFIVDRNVVMITCGVGYGFVPLRFGAAPEVPIVTLVRRGGVAPAGADSVAAPAAVADSLIERFQAGGDSTEAEPVAN